MVCVLFPIAAVVLLILVAVLLVVVLNVKTGRLLMLGLIVALFLVIAVGGAVLFVRSRSLTLTIDTPPGHAYVGKVVADGREIAIRGDTDQELSFPGTVFHYSVILEQPDGVHELTVHDAIASDKSTLGVDGNATRQFPNSATSISGMTQSEWDWAAEELIPGRAPASSGASGSTAPASGAPPESGEHTSPEGTESLPQTESGSPGST